MIPPFRLAWFRAVLWLLLPFALPASSFGQTLESDIAARLIDQPLYLRDSWAENKLKFDASGQPLGAYKRVQFTLAATEVTAVHLKDGRLTLKGRRVGLEFTKTGQMSRIPLNPMQIEVQAPPGGDFSAALDLIFAKDLAGVPFACGSTWRHYAEGRWLPKETGAATADSSGEGERIPKDGSITLPKILRQAAPQFSAAARENKYSATVQVGFVVDTNGMPTKIEITRPAGMGLDEQALAAMTAYRFLPAQRQGKPVAVYLWTEVNFQVF